MDLDEIKKHWDVNANINHQRLIPTSRGILDILENKRSS
jgi:hypothetical protein